MAENKKNTLTTYSFQHDDSKLEITFKDGFREISISIIDEIGDLASMNILDDADGSDVEEFIHFVEQIDYEIELIQQSGMMEESAS